MFVADTAPRVWTTNSSEHALLDLSTLQNSADTKCWPAVQQSDAYKTCSKDEFLACLDSLMRTASGTDEREERKKQVLLDEVN